MRPIQRKYIKNRTNRRVANKKFSGLNQRKGLGRRKPERYSYYAYIGLVVSLIAIFLAVVSIICYNMEL